MTGPVTGQPTTRDTARAIRKAWREGGDEAGLAVSAVLRYTDADGVKQATPWSIHDLVANGQIVAAWCPC